MIDRQSTRRRALRGRIPKAYCTRLTRACEYTIFPSSAQLLNQTQTLYTGTIKFNILLGAIRPAEDVTEDELKAVCRDANILDFIKSLPEYAFHLHKP